MINLPRQSKHQLQLITIASLVIFAGFLWRQLPDQATHFWMLDVGQGDAFLIQINRTNQILIDGGPDDRVLVQLGRLMPFWDRQIELMILTHPHADHLVGLLEVARRYDIGEVWISGALYTTPEFAAWQAVLADRQIPTRIVAAGYQTSLAKIRLLVLAPVVPMANASPRDPHAATVVVRAEIGETKALLTGDLNEQHEQAILESWCDPIAVPCPALAADILKIPHHGSRTGLAPNFLAAIAPRIALISAGKDNAYGHPHASILERLTEVGVPIYRTDQNGSVEVQIFDQAQSIGLYPDRGSSLTIDSD